MATDTSTGPSSAGTSSGATEVTFPVTGMTCASCVRRIEKRLGKVEGVDAVSVNLATEKARVVYDPSVVSFSDLTSAVEKAGYGVGELDAVSAGAAPAGARWGRAPWSESMRRRAPQPPTQQYRTR